MSDMPKEIFARRDEGLGMWSEVPQAAPNDSMTEARYVRADIHEEENKKLREAVMGLNKEVAKYHSGFLKTACHVTGIEYDYIPTECQKKHADIIEECEG